MIVAVAAEPGLSALSGALRRAGLSPRPAHSERAIRIRGFTVGVRLAVLGFLPGTQPLLETEFFEQATILYAHADAESGTVGPVAAAGSSPCPSCLAGRAARGEPSDEGLAWASASAAMEAATWQRLGHLTLYGRALLWTRASGLGSLRFTGRPTCPIPGCRA